VPGGDAVRFETRVERVGEWLGDVPSDWDFRGFCDRHLQGRRDIHERSERLFMAMAEALREGKEVWAMQSGGFWHKVTHCGLYDGWVFWVPRPCYSYIGPIPVPHTDEFYNIRAIRIDGAEMRDVDDAVEKEVLR
jgi:hypothetical protein